jgi:hypothetical protein
MRLYRTDAQKLTNPLRERAVQRVFDELLTAANKVTRVLPIMTSRKAKIARNSAKTGKTKALEQEKESSDVS